MSESSGDHPKPSRKKAASLFGVAVSAILALIWSQAQSFLGGPADQKPDSSTAVSSSASEPDVPTLQVVLNETAPDVKTSEKQKPTTKTETEKQPEKKTPTLGKLRDLGNKKYMSSGGLMYTSGSAEGHRLQHVMRHAKDDPDRPIHGVFDGGYAEILAVIDEAYLIAQKGGRGVQTKKDRDRTVHTVHLGRRIGYMGGQAGARKNKPPLQHLRLVVEGNRVITCFPLRP